MYLRPSDRLLTNAQMLEGDLSTYIKRTVLPDTVFCPLAL